MKEDHQEKKIKAIVIIFALLIVVGTLGFMYVKGTSLWVSFYETMHLMLSHFYDYGGENEAPGLQALTLILIAGSLIIIVSLLRVFGDYLLGGLFKERMKEKNMKKTISHLKDHYIICGYGRVGGQVVEEFRAEDIDFVVIDKNESILKVASEKKGFAYKVGDPTDESVLKAAGIERAKGLVTVLDDDTENLFITMAARGDNPDLFIVARSNTEANIKKFEKAGADRVAMPHKIGGYHIATMALRPSVVDFLNIIVDGNRDELQVEEIILNPGNKLIGQKISSSILSKDQSKTSILAINKKSGKSIINPPGRQVLEPNDKLIILGAKEDLEHVVESI